MCQASSHLQLYSVVSNCWLGSGNCIQVGAWQVLETASLLSSRTCPEHQMLCNILQSPTFKF